MAFGQLRCSDKYKKCYELYILISGRSARSDGSVADTPVELAPSLSIYQIHTCHISPCILSSKVLVYIHADAIQRIHHVSVWMSGARLPMALAT